MSSERHEPFPPKRTVALAQPTDGHYIGPDGSHLEAPTRASRLGDVIRALLQPEIEQRLDAQEALRRLRATEARDAIRQETLSQHLGHIRDLDAQLQVAEARDATPQETMSQNLGRIRDLEVQLQTVAARDTTSQETVSKLSRGPYPRDPM